MSLQAGAQVFEGKNAQKVDAQCMAGAAQTGDGKHCVGVLKYSFHADIQDPREKQACRRPGDRPNDTHQQQRER